MNRAIKRICCLLLLAGHLLACPANPMKDLKTHFDNPPDSARPGVYWYFMDGCLSKEQMTKDLESMRRVGIGSVLFLEVNLWLPRGHLDYFSPEWQETFIHAVKECERLGIEMSLGVGPGWTGSGGPWVEGSESMRHLVGSITKVEGNGGVQSVQLPVPRPRNPYFGEGVFTPELKERWEDYYEDVVVLALPGDADPSALKNIDEKALYYRAPYSSVANVPAVLPEPGAEAAQGKAVTAVASSRIVDITDRLDSTGVVRWNVPDGEWQIIRMGIRNNGAVTRPAPIPGLGFECDKFDAKAFVDHFANSYGKLFPQIISSPESPGGLKCLHMDSWEMGAQNWSDRFAEEFEKRRGYSPTPYLPALLGICIDDVETSERFLRDLRKTAEELVLENHARQIREIAHRSGLKFSVEPYDMTPLSDMRLCETADIPMCEFWTPKGGFNTTYGCVEATSVAHIKGRDVVAAEAFTTNPGENLGYAYYPGNVKAQGDWAFAFGINRFMYHTFAHKYFDNEEARPGLTMGPYGVHWDRGQTWWHLSGEYHKYIARCSYMLRQGRTTADILYLAGEDAPNVFKCPDSAVRYDHPFYPDRREYNFDACTPAALIEDARVVDGKIVFKSGATYEVMVLPMLKCMSVELLAKIDTLVAHGATVIGNPPDNTGSLSNAAENDRRLKALALKLWGSTSVPHAESRIAYGKGYIYWGGKYSEQEAGCLYPGYGVVARLLEQKGVQKDYEDETDKIRYTHRTADYADIFFLSNTTPSRMEFTGRFRTPFAQAEIWYPQSGKMLKAPVKTGDSGTPAIELALAGNESCFIVFSAGKSSLPLYSRAIPVVKQTIDLSRDWAVRFDPAWGGPAQVRFDSLTDWKESRDERIKYYSGSAFYSKNFHISPAKGERIVLRFDSIQHIAAVKINGEYVTTLWTAPWEADITELVKRGENRVEIEVANLWVNRLIKDMSISEENPNPSQWPEWLFNKKKRESQRLSYSSYEHYRADSPLVSSGIIGGAEIVVEK